MVGYDNLSCTYKWFHLHCLGLKSLPKSKHWYCPVCRKLNQVSSEKEENQIKNVIPNHFLIEKKNNQIVQQNHTCC